VAFASTLKGLLNYYLDNRYAIDFAKLCELLVRDRIKSTLSDSCLQYTCCRSRAVRQRAGYRWKN